MNRTLTAAVALATGLGVAGLAYGQSTPMTPAQSYPAQQQPSAATAPATPSPSATGQTSQQGSTKNGEQMGMEQQPSGQGMRGDMSGDPQTVAQAQRDLRSQGLYNGPIDGIIGRETRTALSQFQQQNGLPQTAQLDQNTLDRLNQSSQPQNGGTQQPGATSQPGVGQQQNGGSATH